MDDWSRYYCATSAIDACPFPYIPPELAPATSPQARCWLTPLLECTPRPVIPGDPCLLNTLTLDEYLELVDATGRCLASGKRGTIPAHLRPILERLDISVSV